jgi:uncharacterized hydrophobic protein (TIGR00341 family)
MRIIEVIADCGHADTLRGIAEQHEILEFWVLPTEESRRCSTRMLVRPEKQQTILDAIQAALGSSDHVRIVLIPVEGVLPRPEPEEPEEQKRKAVTRSREELYQQIVRGLQFDSNFRIMVILSTVVAAIGMLANDVAVVIGAMLIAPLLGPNIALAFATSLGETPLIWEALKTNFYGLLLAIFVSLLIGLFWQDNLVTPELLSRTNVGLQSVVLALAAGAAAVLSLAAGWTSSLVGVMVAVALLPPTAAFGIMLGAGQFQNALGAGLLLAINIVCVNLSAKLAFAFKGIKPRTWYEKQKARQSMIAYVSFWLISLAILLVAIEVRRRFL